jgi:uridine kinase
MMVQFIERKLFEKSRHHREALLRLQNAAEEEPLSKRVVVLEDTPQLKFMNTILHDIDTSAEDFIFYFDRLAGLIMEQYVAESSTMLGWSMLTRTPAGL